jgi:hypothetical protein
MSHDATHHHEEDHVESTSATRIGGILLGVAIIVVSTMISKSMQWHVASGGVLTGIFGITFGALGTSVRQPKMAALLGWGGGIAFFASILMFFGLRF